MKELLFDKPFYIDINRARWRVAKKTIAELSGQGAGSIKTCLDIGCGPGWFAERIHRMGIEVTGLEGRRDLIEIAEKRCPDVDFRWLNLEESQKLLQVPAADLVFSFGILYHVENPFLMLRNLHLLTKKYLMIESIVVPSKYPCAWFVDEGKNETQGLSYHSMVLSDPALCAILNRIGFDWVYRFKGRLQHQDFVDTKGKHARRTMIIASCTELSIDDWERCENVFWPKFDYTKHVEIISK